MTKASKKTGAKSTKRSVSNKKTGRQTVKKKRPTARSTGKREKAGAGASRPAMGLPVQDKAAIRSEAFARAILEAKSYASDPDSLRVLFQEASDKAATIPEAAMNGLTEYLQAMLRLIRAYAEGNYKQVARDHLLTIVAAVSYLVDPFDLIPDEIPFLGYVDDATVIEFAVLRAHPALEEFRRWEKSGG